MNKTVRILIVTVALALLSGGLIWAFHSGRADVAADEQADAPIQGPSRATTEQGRTVIALPADVQRENRIIVTALPAVRHTVEAQATGVVLDLQPILNLETSYSAATMDLSKARASADASRTELQRLERLERDGQNASVKAVEAARATAESDGAVEQNAEQALAILKSTIALHWGPALANWVEKGSPQLNALLTQRMFLLQVTAVNAAARAASRATVELPDGTHVSAELLSAIPQVDPRLQMPSFLYLVPAQNGLVPGRNIQVFLPAGPAQNGVVVPATAVVWLQGKPWCYVEQEPGKFTRSEVPAANPIADGWFVPQGLAPGVRVVTSGAQTLLSEEFRSELQVDQDED